MAYLKYHATLLVVAIAIGFGGVYALDWLKLTSDAAVWAFVLIGIAAALVITRLITGRWKA